MPLEKTLLSRKTDEIVIPATFSTVDPLRELRNMFRYRISSKIPAIYPHKKSFLFVTASGKPIDGQCFNMMLDLLCNLIQLPRKRVSPHSFRIGGATSLINRGIPDVVVQLLGRWNSDAYKSYVRLDKEFLANFACKMC